MTQHNIIKALIGLGTHLKNLDFENEQIVRKAVQHNPWFATETIQQSLTAIANEYLNEEKLNKWVAQYSFANKSESKRIGIVMAGNIPLVGFHDLLCVLMSGHKAIVKMSEKDEILTQYVIDKLISNDVGLKDRIQCVDRLKSFDAIIATGSDSASVYFEKYFSAYPHIIRKNRNAVAIITGEEDTESLSRLGVDIFSYFGLGCRNVSKIYLPDDYEISQLIDALDRYREVINHNKYKNNYDYNHALYLLNKSDFLTNDFLIFLKNEIIASRIACLHYENYKNLDAVVKDISFNESKIQCVVSEKAIEGLDTVRFGKAQNPSLNDYADGVDTMLFLNKLQ